MKLNYKILWIDDKIDSIISLGIKDYIQEYLESLEFITSIDCYETAKLETEIIKQNNYDLILSDFEVDEDGQNADVLIKKIRNYDIFTEVLFYSGHSEFIQSLIGVDRISYFSLEGDEGYKGFKQKVIELISQTVYKLQELNSIRGLVMSETSELDNTVIDILNDFFSTESDETLKLRNYIIDSVIESSDSNSKRAKKFNEFSNADIIKERIFDADKKARTIGKLIILKNLDKTEPFIDFYKNYKKDVLDTRNDLAHAKSDIIDDIEYLIVSRKDGEHPEKFDQENCIQIRRNLRKHSDVLKSIREIIIEKANTQS